MPIARIAAWRTSRWAHPAQECAVACFCAAFWAFLTGTAACPADEAPAAPECEHADFLLAGLRDARLRLRSGVFEGQGHVVKSGGASGPVEGEVTMFCAFDYDRGLMRMDRAEPQLFFEDGQREVRMIRSKIARTSQRTVSWDNQAGVDDNGFVSIYMPEWKPEKHALPVDVRTFGLSGWGCVTSSWTFDDLYQSVRTYNVLGIEGGPSGICIVTFLHGDKSDMKSRLWIDHKCGFSVKRNEFQGLDITRNQWSGIVSLSEVQWEEVSAVWVPKSLVLHRRFNGDETYSVNLKWSSVNQPIPPELFEPEGLGVENGTPVLDYRLGGKPIALGRLGESAHRPYALKRPSGKQSPRGLFLIVNTLLVALAAGYWWFKRRRRVAARTATSSESASPDSEDTKRMSPRRPDLE